MDHLSDLDVEGVLKGELGAEDLRRVVRHLLTRCVQCSTRLFLEVPRDWFLPWAPVPDPDLYDASIDRALREARRKTRRWPKDQERFERGLAWVREAGSFSGLAAAQRRTILTWTHVQILLGRSFETRYANPRMMLELSKSAQAVVDRIEETPYGFGFLSDLRVQTWIELANAYRVNESFYRADQCVQHARTLLEQGTGDPLLEARTNDVEASLRKDQRRFKEACALLDEAYRIYLSIGDRHLAGRALVSKGISLWLSGAASASAGALRRGISLLDAHRDPKLLTTARHDLLTALVDAGKLREAGQLLIESGLRQAFADDPHNLLRLRWVEGKILASRGRVADAEKVFSDVRSGFRKEGLEYVAAIAGVDQVTMLLHQRKNQDAYLLAFDLWVTFRRFDIESEAAKAMQFLEMACRMQVASATIAERVREFLKNYERDSRLRFEPRSMLR